MERLAVSDLTRLWMDELYPLACELGVRAQYEEIAKSGRIDFEQTNEYLKLLYDKPLGWIASKIGDAEPYEGSKEAMECLKKEGYSVFLVTDNVLMSLPECNRIIREKLGAEKIIPTAEIACSGGKICGLENMKSKPQILGGLLKEYRPSGLFCMVQGENDIGMAVSSKQRGATVVSVNSHSPMLEGASDYHAGSIAEMPGLLERIFTI